MMHGFRAYIAEEHDGRFAGRIAELTTDDLPAGEVTIEVEYSSLNYKDALAARGRNKVASRYPHVPGIDAAGVVVESSDRTWAVGERVVATGYEIGAGRFGGFARLLRVPASWVVRLPASLSTFDAMAIGTAGYTAALALLALERNGTRPDGGPIVVTGATGGVGCIAVDLLAARGYEVVASTGKPSLHGWLRELGAATVVDRAAVSLPSEAEPRPLMPARYGGAIDSVGGGTLDYLLRTTRIGGNVALTGLVGGATFRGTVMPFILRGVGLLGIDSGHTPIEERQAIWNRLASDLRPPRLASVTRTVTLGDLDQHIEAMLRGESHGRIVVDVTR